MFLGEYRHNLDSKRRIAIPAKFRKELGEKSVLTRGLDQCLFLYPAKEWENLASNLGKLPIGKSDTRSFLRLLLSGAQEVEIDQLGRVLIPDFLKNYAVLKREVVIVGVYNRVELWDKESWEGYKKLSERSSDETAEKLGELGLY